MLVDMLVFLFLFALAVSLSSVFAVLDDEVSGVLFCLVEEILDDLLCTIGVWSRASE
jgi:hypothetical protein